MRDPVYTSAPFLRNLETIHFCPEVLLFTISVKEMGLSLYLENGYSNTVTVIRVPDGIKADDILELMKKDHNIMIAGSFDVLTGQVIRIGHMGENANEADVVETLEALKSVLNKLSA